jgi:glutamate 5-kinase
LHTLLQIGAIPIINENDTVAAEEIKFGIMTPCPALVAEIVDADLLIILSDIDGLYEEDPRANPHATLYNELEEIRISWKNLYGGAATSFPAGACTPSLPPLGSPCHQGLPCW